MNIGYYPGCALHGSSNDYEKSVRACMDLLGVSLRELDDWLCCGATAAHSLNAKLGIALPARNLGIAERDGIDEVLAPCPMCSMELIKAGDKVSKDAALREEISEIVELPVTGKTSVINLIQMFQAIGEDAVKEKVSRPLTGFRPACYYGCLLTRPPEVLKFDDCEQPTSMESLLKTCGADPIDWNYKTECCGAGMTMCNESTVLKLSNKILSDAKRAGANCVVVACPMCHVNLDMKQGDINAEYNVEHDMMIYYLSDLVGLSMGLTEDDLAIKKHFVYVDLPGQLAKESG